MRSAVSGRRRGTKQSFASISVSPSHYSSYNQETQTEIQDFWRFSTRSILVILKIKIFVKIFCSPDIVDIHKSGKIASLITVRVPVSTKRIDWSPPYTLIFINFFSSKVHIDFHPSQKYKLASISFKMYTRISTLFRNTIHIDSLTYQNVHIDFYSFTKHSFMSTIFKMYTLISTLFKSTN